MGPCSPDLTLIHSNIVAKQDALIAEHPVFAQKTAEKAPSVQGSLGIGAVPTVLLCHCEAAWPARQCVRNQS